MTVCFHPQAWEDYQWWQQSNGPLAARVSALIADIRRDPRRGIGKPEPLADWLQGFWSRRIDSVHRIVYRVEGGSLFIAQCRGHYGD